MTEDQAQAWLTIEGWRPAGVYAPGNAQRWYGVVNSEGECVALNGDQFPYQIRHESLGPRFGEKARKRHWLPERDASMFADYIQEHGL